MTTLAAHRTNLQNNHYPIGSPAWIIVNDANLAAADAPAQMLRKLMDAFYDYGRTHWQWTQSSPAAAGNGGLLRGTATNCACATFNGNLKLLAEHACGIAGIANQTYTTQFLTVPGGVCIDSRWHGNVRTSRDGYPQFKCFKFSQHYWLQFGGLNYDVCYNNTFAAQQQIVFTTLTQMPVKETARYGRNQTTLYRLTRPLPSAAYLVQVADGAQGPCGWPGWQLVSEAELRLLR